MRPTITAFDWVPDFAKGLVRDLRVRWALEEVGQPYDVIYLSQGEQKQAPHRGRQPFRQLPTFEKGDVLLFESGRKPADILPHPVLLERFSQKVTALRTSLNDVTVHSEAAAVLATLIECHDLPARRAWSGGRGGGEGVGFAGLGRKRQRRP